MITETADLREKVEKYKAQQFDVKTTREYDAITFQLEDSQRRLHSNMDKCWPHGHRARTASSGRAADGARSFDMQRELQEAEAALSEVLAAPRKTRSSYVAKREGLVKQIQPYYLTIYNRVRPAKAGVAVVALRNGACGGCYNAIPRQMVLELKKAEKHTVCEYCGRIVVGDPIAIAVDGEPQPVTYEVDEDGEEIANGDDE